MNSFYDYTTYTLIVACFFSAILRHFHMCRPFSEQSDYYYPARKETTFFFAYCGFAFIPSWLYGDQSFGLLYNSTISVILYPAFFVLMMTRYFVKKRTSTKRILLALAAITPSLPFTVDAYTGGNILLCHYEFTRYYSLIFGIIQCMAFVKIAVTMIKRLKQYQLSNYSCDDDFPYKFASIVLNFTCMCLFIFWIIWFTESRMVIAINNIIITFICIHFVLIILHPQQKGTKRFQLKVKEESSNITIEDTGVVDDAAEEEVIPSEKQVIINNDLENKIAFNIKLQINDKQCFLDPHFSLPQLANLIGQNRTITSKVCNDQFGGFYKLINEARIAHAEQLQGEHPNYTQDAIAKESGFSNRQTYLRVKKRLAEDLE